ncbi:MAG: hypothetical protein HY465_05185 [Deltaproteobacteria bacterium]|nr:hypothetical protein [Deltaproteobacteria bacterium]
MRRNDHRRICNIILKWFLMLVVAMTMVHCAKVSRPGHKRLPSEERKDIPPSERSEEQLPTTPDASTPRRVASQQLVDKGIASLDAGNTAAAMESFQEAINIDATNGIAYYYLARSTYEGGQGSSALGFLDQAEALLGDDPAWLEEIVALRDEIAGEGESLE